MRICNDFTRFLFGLCFLCFVRFYYNLYKPCGWNNGGSWAAGLAYGDHPFNLEYSQVPSITCASISDIPAGFVADPFLLGPAEEGDEWTMFFEIMNNLDGSGDIGMATSLDLISWNYYGVVLDENFHLSYPFVVRIDSKIYMIPETNQKNQIRLYEATDSTLSNWHFVSTLVDGAPYVDSSAVHVNGMWYMYSWTRAPNHLYLFMAENFTGPWRPHPLSPLDDLVDYQYRRPGGRPVVENGNVLRYAQDGSLGDFTYGSALFAIEVTRLTKISYEERVVKPIGPDSGKEWISQRIHTVDPWLLSNGTWVAVIDGDSALNIPITRFFIKMGVITLLGIIGIIVFYTKRSRAKQ
eukprot:CFRG8422T1